MRHPLPTLLLIALAGSLAGCETVTLSTRNSLSPVLLGPVKTLPKAKEPRSTGPRPEPAHEQLSRYVTATKEFAATTASEGGGSSSVHEHTASTRGDWDVLISTNGDPRRYISLDGIDCNGYALVLVVGIRGHARIAQNSNVTSFEQLRALYGAGRRSHVPRRGWGGARG